MKTKIAIKAPAKVNLTLDVIGKRSDGYHELETVMHQIDLLDVISIASAPAGIKISSSSNLIPLNEDNLVYRAADLLLQKYGSGEGIEIFIEKNIPVGAGLAGGSTDAAAAIRGINELFGYGLQQPDMLELGAEIGSDVPFCIMGGTAVARGRGELLTPVEGENQLLMVLVKPDFQLSTAAIYGGLDLAKVEKFPDNFAFLEAWNNYDIISIALNMENVLESVSIKEFPEIAEIKSRLIQMGALNALMSGSGPSVFGIFAEKARALQAADYFKARYDEVFLVSSYIERGDRY